MSNSPISNEVTVVLIALQTVKVDGKHLSPGTRFDCGPKDLEAVLRHGAARFATYEEATA